MRKSLHCMIIVCMILFYSCNKNPSEPIQIDPAMLPPVQEIKYNNYGAFNFGFGNSGSIKFSTDISDNQFKIILNKEDYFGPTAYTTIFTYKYDREYNLIELERYLPDLPQRVSIKLYYSENSLTHFEEWEGNKKYNTYKITNETIPSGRRLTVGTYTGSNGSGLDTLNHSLTFDNQNRVVSIYERARHTGPFPGLSVDNFNLYYSGNNVASKQGSQTYTDFSTRKDSMWTTVSYTRMLNENPVLEDYLTLMYGADFYAIINNCTGFLFKNFSVSSASDLFKLHAQKRATAVQTQYSSLIYNNGVFAGNQGSTNIQENTLDSKKRLIKSKYVSTLTPANYNTWEIVYQ